MIQRKDKMDELFPDFEKIGRYFKKLAWIALAFLVVSLLVCAACGK